MTGRVPWFQLRRLARFSGREPRALFWPWVACVIVGNMLVGMIVAVPIVTGFMRKVAVFAETHPDRVTTRLGPGPYSVDIDGLVPPDLFFGEMRWFLLLMIVVAAVTVGLLAAAVVRRLHDSGRGGWWGLLPLPFLVIGFATMASAFHRVGAVPAKPDLMPFVLLFANNMVYLAMLALLVVQLCRPSDPGPNRFGPPAA